MRHTISVLISLIMIVSLVGNARANDGEKQVQPNPASGPTEFDSDKRTSLRDSLREMSTRVAKAEVLLAQRENSDALGLRIADRAENYFQRRLDSLLWILAVMIPILVGLVGLLIPFSAAYVQNRKWQEDLKKVKEDAEKKLADAISEINQGSRASNALIMVSSARHWEKLGDYRSAIADELRSLIHYIASSEWDMTRRILDSIIEHFDMRDQTEEWPKMIEKEYDEVIKALETLEDQEGLFDPELRKLKEQRETAKQEIA